MDYGEGLTVEWDRREAACIIRAHARRFAEGRFGLPKDEVGKSQAYHQHPGLKDEVEQEALELLMVAARVGAPIRQREVYGQC